MKTKTFQVRAVWYVGETEAASYPADCSADGMMFNGRPPDTYGVYAHQADGTLEHVLDCDTEAQANDWARTAREASHV